MSRGKRIDLLEDPKWTEAGIARAVQHSKLFQRKVIVVPGCYAAGHEADLLCVEPGGKLIEVEIKTSRADLLADPAKDKWVRRLGWDHQKRQHHEERLEWPGKVWKHYYLMPTQVYRGLKPEDLAALPRRSGLLVFAPAWQSRGTTPLINVECMRRSQGNAKAKPLDGPGILNMARLADLRLWEALWKHEK